MDFGAALYLQETQVFFKTCLTNASYYLCNAVVKPEENTFKKENLNT